MRKSAKSDMGLLLCAAFRHKYGLPFLTRVVMAELMQCSRERVRQIEGTRATQDQTPTDH